MKAAELVLDCRMAAAELFHVPEPEQVVFTMNATHALNIAISSLVKKGSRVLISGFEHNAVTRPLRALGAEIIVADAVLFDKESFLDDVKRKIDGAEVIVCTQVSNVFGFVLPVYEVAELCREKRIPLIIDASQSAGILPVDMEKLGTAFIAMPGHKALLGPQGTGLLLCGVPGQPLLFGGSGSDSASQSMPSYLPDRMEAGTHNVPGIAGLLEGMRFVMDRGTDAIEYYEQQLIFHLADGLEYCDEYELFLGERGSQSGVLSLRSHRFSSEELAFMLSERDICVRAGLHCAPLAHQSAGTIEDGTVRLSVSLFTDHRQIDAACRALREIASMRERH